MATRRKRDIDSSSTSFFFLRPCGVKSRKSHARVVVNVEGEISHFHMIVKSCMRACLRCYRGGIQANHGAGVPQSKGGTFIQRPIQVVNSFIYIYASCMKVVTFIIYDVFYAGEASWYPPASHPCGALTVVCGFDYSPPRPPVVSHPSWHPGWYLSMSTQRTTTHYSSPPSMGRTVRVLSSLSRYLCLLFQLLSPCSSAARHGGEVKAYWIHAYPRHRTWSTESASAYKNHHHHHLSPHVLQSPVIYFATRTAAFENT